MDVQPEVAARQRQQPASGPGRLCASPLTCSPFGTCRPVSSSGSLLASLWPSSTSARRRRSRPLTAGQPCAISGLVQSGTLPLPGAAVVALGADGAEISSTSSEQNGSYVLRLSGPGTYTIRASLAAFAPATREATLAAGDCNSRLDLALVLASRAPRRQRRAARRRATPRRQPRGPAHRLARGRSRQTATAAARTRPRRCRRPGRGGFQQLDVVTNATGEQAAPRRTKTRRRLCAPNCSCLRDSRPMRRPRPLPRRASRGSRTTRCSLAGAAGAASSAKAAPTASDAAALASRRVWRRRSGRLRRRRWRGGGPRRRTWRRRPRRPRRIRRHARRRTHPGQRQLHPRRVDVRCRAVPAQRSRARGARLRPAALRLLVRRPADDPAHLQRRHANVLLPELLRQPLAARPSTRTRRSRRWRRAPAISPARARS